MTVASVDEQQNGELDVHGPQTDDKVLLEVPGTEKRTLNIIHEQVALGFGLRSCLMVTETLEETMMRQTFVFLLAKKRAKEIPRDNGRERLGPQEGVGRHPARVGVGAVPSGWDGLADGARHAVVRITDEGPQDATVGADGRHQRDGRPAAVAALVVGVVGGGARRRAHHLVGALLQRETRLVARPQPRRVGQDLRQAVLAQVGQHLRPNQSLITAIS